MISRYYMIKKICITAFLFIVIHASFAQKILTLPDSIATYFNEIKIATKKNQILWNKNLYGPILLINPDTRQLYANYPDSAGFLKQNGKIYSGVLPSEIIFANTAINWSGRRWAMIMLPLPENKENRINLLAHELFHKAQPSLGFILFNTNNNHLDQKDGRIYLRLELEALKKAVQATNDYEKKTQLTNAFTFRKYRYSLYAGADTTENLLELNEGLAEYTGLLISGRNTGQAIKHFETRINAFLSNPTFVRSFAYETTPMYGYLLYNTKKEWNKNITSKTNLTNYFIKAFDLSIPGELQKRVEIISKQYNAKAIFAEETAREEKTKLLIAAYKNKFIEQPHFEIKFEHRDMFFDPRNILPIEDKGTLYQSIRVTDNWGILNVENGALLSPDWNMVSLTIPGKTDGKKISGDGWTLELNDGYTIIRDETTGNFKMTKK
jgi:hypothetical protein